MGPWLVLEREQQAMSACAPIVDARLSGQSIWSAMCERVSDTPESSSLPCGTLLRATSSCLHHVC